MQEEDIDTHRKYSTISIRFQLRSHACFLMAAVVFQPAEDISSSVAVKIRISMSRGKRVAINERG